MGFNIITTSPCIENIFKKNKIIKIIIIHTDLVFLPVATG
jgi:hypothetical protein